MGVSVSVTGGGFVDEAAVAAVELDKAGQLDVAAIDKIVRDGARLRDYPRDLAAKYEEAREQTFYNEYVFLFVLGCVVSFATIAVDILVDPYLAREGVILRLLTTGPVTLIGLYAGARRWTTLMKIALAAGAVTFMGVLAHMALHLPAADAARYLLATATVVAISNITLPFSLRGQAIFNFFAIALTFAVVAWGGTAVLQQHFRDLAVLVIVAFATLPIAARVERLRRLNFLLNLRTNLVGLELVEANNSLRHLSETDALTGVANRRCFEARYQSEIAREGQAFDLSAIEGKNIGLMMIDLDHFKPFNDMHGHQAGDVCLQMVARSLEQVCDARGAIFARYGGEEFIAAIRADTADQIVALAEEARASVSSTLTRDCNQGRALITASIGVAIAPASAFFPREELIEMADAALYSGKNAGRNRVEVVEAMPFVPSAAAFEAER